MKFGRWQGIILQGPESAFLNFTSVVILVFPLGQKLRATVSYYEDSVYENLGGVEAG